MASMFYSDGDTTVDSEYYTTIEDQDLFQTCFPDLFTLFDQTIAAKKPAKKGILPFTRSI